MRLWLLLPSLVDVIGAVIVHEYSTEFIPIPYPKQRRQHSSRPPRHFSLRQNHCYSCMSPGYEEYFDKGLDRYFSTPKNFTHQCDEPMDPKEMQVTSCRTICLTVQQDLYILGQPTGRRLTMRGCALTLSKRGLNNHTLSMFDRYDICREMSASDLFRHDKSDSQRIRVCSCLGDRCNSSSGVPRALLFVVLLLFTI